MNSLLDDNDEDIQDNHRGRAGRGQDREITLGTTVILGIFFALAVVIAVSVGFGYSLGVKHTNSIATGSQADPNATFNGFKPPSGKTASDLAKGPTPESVTVPLTTPPALPRATIRPAGADSATSAAAEPLPTPVNLSASVPVRAPAMPVAARPAAVATATPAPAGALMVQIAAVSHQEDADLLVSTLKRRSYAVAIHHENQDQLLHVQVGPFATKKDADAMRSRLQADGFNAIVKDPSR